MWHKDIPDEYRNQIVTGDALELAKRLPDESVDLIFTDPPYHRRYLLLYSWLANEAARILKPSGFLMTYCGNAWKCEVMARLRRRLDFFWDYQAIEGGKATMVWDRLTVAKTKSVLCYRKRGSKARPRTSVLGMWVGSGRDKRYHDWAQDESTARYYIDCFTQIGDVILDPFTGGGTVPSVCSTLDRSFIAFEIDGDTASDARLRLEQMPVPLLVPEPQQLALEVGD